MNQIRWNLTIASAGSILRNIEVTFQRPMLYHNVPWKLSPAFKKIGFVAARFDFSCLTAVTTRAYPPMHFSPGLHEVDRVFVSSNLLNMIDTNMYI